MENLLLDADGHIKLTDLSLVYEVGNEVSCGATTKSFDVLPPYLPPEVCHCQLLLSIVKICYYLGVVICWKYDVTMYINYIGMYVTTTYNEATAISK